MVVLDGRSFTAWLVQDRRSAGILLIAFAALLASIASGAFDYSSLCSYRFTPSAAIDCFDSFQAINAAFPHYTDKDKEVVVVTRRTRGDGEVAADLLGPRGRALLDAIDRRLAALPAAAGVGV